LALAAAWPASAGNLGHAGGLSAVFPVAGAGAGPLISLLCLPLFVLGVWACQKTGDALGVHDYGGIVWDEVVAMLLVLAWAPAAGQAGCWPLRCSACLIL
jgi:phosphatidylglycerophosphatase A